MGLSDEDKKRIREEEEFRAQVRKELANEQQPKPPESEQPVRTDQPAISPKGTKHDKVIAVGAVVLFIAMAPFLATNDKAKPSPEEQAAKAALEQEKRERRACNEDDTAAFVMAQKFVKPTLKAPATADFAPMYDSQVTNVGDCTYEVHSYVDAQNSFGANIRTRFNATVKYKGDGRWSLVALK